MQATHVTAGRIQGEQLASVSSSFLRLRPKLLLPAAPVLAALLVSAEVPQRQLFAILGTLALMLGFFTWEAWRLRERQLAPRAFARSLVITLIGLSCVCGFSGGPQSPFLPILFAPIGIAFAAFGASRLTGVVLAALFGAILYITASLWLFPWTTIRTPHVHGMLLLATAISTTLLFFGVTGLAKAYRQSAARLEEMRLEVLEAASRRTADLEAVGARVAHELKNPLASVKGLVQLVHDGLQRSPGEGPARSLARLGVVLEEVSRIEGVLGGYLAFSRPLTELCRSQQRLDSFLQSFAELISGEAERAGVSVELDCKDISAEFDAAQLRRTLLNLAQNALHAMQRGGRLKVRGRATPESVIIEIDDNGSGMSADELARVKEPYFTRREGGTGLGVVIANGIVTQHGGELSFTSRQGHGTTASIVLPQPWTRST